MRKRLLDPTYRPSSLGTPACTELPSGVRVITDTVPHARTIALGVWIECGSRHDTIAGIAHMLEHVLFRRSQRTSGTARSRRVESLGAYLNASTSKELTCYDVRGLAEHLEQLADILFELVFAPAFTPRDVEKERAVIAEEIRSYEDDPEEVVCDALDELLFGTHPLAHPIAGTLDSVACIMPSDLEAFHRTYYVGARCAVIASGPIEHRALVEFVERALERWNVPSGTRSMNSPPPRRRSPQQHALPRAFQQAHCALGIRVAGAQHPDRHALAVLNILWGDSSTSRLYRRVREQRALAYNVYSTLQLWSDCGELTVYAGTHPDRISAAIDGITNEIARLGTAAPTHAEFRRAQQQLRASFVMSTESLSARMHALARMVLEEKTLEPIEAGIESIEDTTLEQVQSLAASLSDPSQWCVVICQ
jgi:predicted Zn-dependent peptidase